MRDFVKERPSIFLYICCYHYHKYFKDKDNRPKIIYTYKDKERFPYKYWRDISGEIKLDINNSRCKYYASLNVIQEVIFIDNETLNDYKRNKENFLRAHKNRDNKYEFSEYIEIGAIKDINIIKLYRKELPFIGCGWYIIFTLLSLSSVSENF